MLQYPFISLSIVVLCFTAAAHPIALSSDFESDASILGVADYQPVRLPRVAGPLQPPKPEDEYVTKDELQSLLKRWTWKVGEFKVSPYGAFWADMIYATERTNPGAGTLYVFSPETHGEDAFTIDARRSRFGLDVTGPTIPALGWSETGGKVEIDFRGDFITENRAGVLLRHAYWEATTSQSRLLVGQTWDVISPLQPGVLNYAAGYNAGNIGFRRTQFRAERYFEVSPCCKFTFQGSLNQDIVTDFPTDPGVNRETSDWPVVEGRMAVILGRRGHGAEPVQVGVSGHIGETGLDFLTPGPPPLNLPPLDDARFKTWSLNVDVRFPITDRFGFQGEFYTGANLSPYLGGIGQGVCPCLRVPIRSTGGWFEVWYDWTTRLHSHAGFGLDDPNDRDSLLGRIYNHFVFVNLVVDVTDRLTTGCEVTSWKTLYHEKRVGQIPPNELTPSQPGESITLDWMIKYSF